MWGGRIINLENITPYDIGLYLTTYKEKDWKFEYGINKKKLIQAVVYGDYTSVLSSEKDIKEFKQWMENNPDWLKIIKSDDVALFPDCLREFKKTYLINKDKDYIESCLLNKNNNYLKDLVVSNRANYGVFKLDMMVGHKILKDLLKHLNMTYNDFINVYGEELYYNVDCLDDIISEMIITGEVVGEKRKFKTIDEII